MRQCECVKADTPSEFAHEYNVLSRKISRIGKVIREKDISDTEVLVFYEIPDEEEPKKKTPEAKRYCCECDNYNWGKGCPYSEGHVRLMDNACGHFTVILEGRIEHD